MIRRQRDPQRSTDDGFSLIEVIVALVILAIVAAATLTLFVRAIGSARDVQGKQEAIPVAQQALDFIRAIPAQVDDKDLSKLVKGRSASGVGRAVDPDLDRAQPRPDPDLPSGADRPRVRDPGGAVSDDVRRVGQDLHHRAGGRVLLPRRRRPGVGLRPGLRLQRCTLPGAGRNGPPLPGLRRGHVGAVSRRTRAERPAPTSRRPCIDPSRDPLFNTNDSIVPPPIANNDSLSMSASKAATADCLAGPPVRCILVPLLDNDSGSFASSDFVVIAQNPLKGTVQVSPSLGTTVLHPQRECFRHATTSPTSCVGLGNTTSASATVSITINPVAKGGNHVAGRDKSLTIAPLGNDIGTFGANAVTLSSGTTSAGGSVTLSGNNVVYTPPAGFTGNDSFTYRATDTSALQTGLAVIAIRVYPPPTAVADVASTSANLAGLRERARQRHAPLRHRHHARARAAESGQRHRVRQRDERRLRADRLGSPAPVRSSTHLSDTWGNVSNTVTVLVTVKPTALALGRQHRVRHREVVRPELIHGRVGPELQPGVREHRERHLDHQRQGRHVHPQPGLAGDRQRDQRRELDGRRQQLDRPRRRPSR